MTEQQRTEQRRRAAIVPEWRRRQLEQQARTGRRVAVQVSYGALAPVL